jgi:hypothetical protein
MDPNKLKSVIPNVPFLIALLINVGELITNFTKERVIGSITLLLVMCLSYQIIYHYRECVKRNEVMGWSFGACVVGLFTIYILALTT